MKRWETRTMRYVWARTLCTAGCLLVVLTSAGCGTSDRAAEEADGFVWIFDGESLEGWEGDPAYWRVENGALVGEVTPSTLLERNTFIIWRGGWTRDFELKLEYLVSAEGNSGINYRSEEVDGVPFALRGYQADLDGANRYTGSNYEERGRTTLAAQGEVTIIPAIEDAASVQEHVEQNRWTPAETVRSLGSSTSLDARIHSDDWNDYHLVVENNRMRHFVNGVLMSDVTDNDTLNRRFEGLLGVQVHVGPPMKVEYRNIRLKQLD